VEFGGGGVASNGKSRCSRGGCKWDGQIELWSNGLPKGLTITELLNSKLVAPGITCLDAALTGRRGGKGEYTGSIGYNEYGSINSIELIRCESSSFKLNFRVLDSQRLWSIKTISSSKDIYLRRFYPDIGDLANNAILLFPGNDGKVTTTTQSKDVYFEESDYLDSSIRYLKNYGWIMMPLSFSTSKGFFIIDRKKYSNIEKYITEEKSSKQYGYYSNIVKFKANGKWWKYNEGLSDWKSFEPVK